MGYTHYWDIKSPLEQKTFKLFTDDVKKIINFVSNKKNKNYIRLTGIDGSESEESNPYVNDDGVFLNGFDLDAHETFCIKQKDIGSDFCKTQRKPYDKVVTAILLLFKEYFPDVVLISDGTEEDWEFGKKLCYESTGKDLNINSED